MNAPEEAERVRHDLERLESQLRRVIVGQDRVVREVLVALLAGGHVLLEGAPGLGKTLLVRSLAQALRLEFRRIQFTPDLMPADVTGTNVVVEDAEGRKRFEFRRGPVFANLLLADEINRATPRTQSALLEAMQERAVTVAGERHPIAPPFFVLATQNPIEMEGTYPLPEAQLDRFLFKVLVDPPDEATLVAIVDRTTGADDAVAEPVLDGPRLVAIGERARGIAVAEPLVRWASRLVRATQPDAPEAAAAAKRYLRYGAGVRGAQALVLAAKVAALLDGRPHVAFEDLRAWVKPALRHRLILNFEGEAEGIPPDDVLEQVLHDVPEVPRDVSRLGG